MQQLFPASMPLGRRTFLTRLSAGFLGFAAPSALSAPEGANRPLTEVANGLFVHRGATALANEANRGDICNQTVVIGTEAVAVIDTSGSALAGAALKDAIAALTDRPIRYVINTHMHPDHVLGNAAFDAGGVTFIGHHKLPRALAARAESYLRRARETLAKEFEGTRIVLPTRTVETTESLDLGNRKITLVARPTAHTDNDLTIFDETTATLVAGDLVFAEHIPTLDGSIVGWLKLIEVLKQQQAARVVPGHGPIALPWPDAVAPEQHYLETVAADVRAAIRDGRTMAEAVATAAQSEKDKWQLFEDHHARNVTAAFAELEWE